MLMAKFEQTFVDPPIPPPQWRLSQCQLPIPVCRHRLAAIAEGGVAAAETHDPAGLFAFDIAVDAGHPRVDLVGQQALARRNDLAWISHSKFSDWFWIGVSGRRRRLGRRGV